MRVLTTIPFQGFFCSRHSEALDHELDYILEYKKAKGFDLDWDDFEYDYTAYGVAYLGNYKQALSQQTGIPFDLEFDSVISPRKYNFNTDVIYARVDLGSVRALREYIGDSNLRATIKDRFTSRSGFISFYSNNLDEWDHKDMADWDHNQIGTVFEAALQDRNNIEMLVVDEVYNYIIEKDVA